MPLDDDWRLLEPGDGILASFLPRNENAGHCKCQPGFITMTTAAAGRRTVVVLSAGMMVKLWNNLKVGNCRTVDEALRPATLRGRAFISPCLVWLDLGTLKLGHHPCLRLKYTVVYNPDFPIFFGDNVKCHLYAGFQLQRYSCGDLIWHHRTTGY